MNQVCGRFTGHLTLLPEHSRSLILTRGFVHFRGLCLSLWLSLLGRAGHTGSVFTGPACFNWRGLVSMWVISAPATVSLCGLTTESKKPFGPCSPRCGVWPIARLENKGQKALVGVLPQRLTPPFYCAASGLQAICANKSSVLSSRTTLPDCLDCFGSTRPAIRAHVLQS